MADKGIIFSAPMVRALLAGTKTQTRRLLRNPEYYGCPTGDCPHKKQVECNDAMAGIDKPYAPGDRLYVRECWAPIDRCTHNDPGTDAMVYRGFYRADNSTIDGEILRWTPAIHMPRWASRLWLAVTDVRVQRLQDISEADAVAEGVDEAAITHFGAPSRAYAALWNHLHGAENDHSWEANPWIVAVTFTVNQGNIDG